MDALQTPEDQDREAMKQDMASDFEVHKTIFQKGIMAKQNNFMNHGNEQFPVSRDFGLADMPCAMNDCVANNGSGKCIILSFIKIGADGKCAGYQSMNKKKGENNDKDIS